MYSRRSFFVVLWILSSVIVLLGGGIVGAQDASLTQTFELPTVPSGDGALVGVDPAGQVVTYWHQHTGDHAVVMDDLVAEFNAGNPWGITVEASNQGSYGDIYQKMMAGIVAGDLPDLVVAFQGQAATYQLEGSLVDMDAYVTDAQWGYSAAEFADFFPGFMAHDVSPQFEARLGFPLSRSMEMLYVNLDGLAELGYDAPPTTWAEFNTMACAWTSSDAGRVGFTLHTDTSFLSAATFALGGDVFDGTADEYVYDSAATTYILGLMQEMDEQGCVNRLSERNGDRVDFANQTNLFYFGSSAAVPYVEAAIAESEAGDFNWTISAVPYGDLGAEGPTQKLNGASVSMPQSTPEEQLATWLFVRWLAEPDQQARWAQVTNYFPVRASAAAEMTDYFAANAGYATAFELLDNTMTVPTVAGYDIVRAMVETDGVLPVLDGASVAETLATITASVNEVYHTQFK